MQTIALIPEPDCRFEAGKFYDPPAIIYQAPLEVRAGSPFGMFDPLEKLTEFQVIPAP